MTHLSLPRWQATYAVTANDRAAAEQVAHNLAVEQTIEYPYELVEGTWYADEMTGRIEALEPFNETEWKVTVSYPAEAVQGEILQLLNMLYGNSSLQIKTRLLDFTLSPELAAEYPGPRYGLNGLRDYWQVPAGPLVMAVLKPIGHSSREFAAMASAFARAGVAVVKDDHSLHNQKFSPFRERVTVCVDAIANANAQSGHHTAYLPNITSAGAELIERALCAQELGANGIMVAPALTGWGSVHELANHPDFTLPIVCHPSWSGPMVRGPRPVVSPFVYNGLFPRLAGADSVIVVGGGGRFGVHNDACLASRDGALCAWGNCRPLLPAIGGGMTLDAIAELPELYGDDIMYLVGGALFRESPDIEENARRFLAGVETIYAHAGNAR